MAHSPHPADAPIAAAEEENIIGDYSAVSGLAVVGLILALLSVAALIHPLLWLLPLTAAVVNALALRQIAAASPRLVGRRAALVGLAIAMVFAISAPIQRLVHRRDLQSQSVEIAREWFTALRENHPDLAHRLTQYPTSALARSRSAAEKYKNDTLSAEGLRTFVHEPAIQSLLNLGKRARVRYYENEDIWADRDMEGVRDIYVITVGEGEQAVSFFMKLGTTRTPDPGTDEWQWQVSKHEVLHKPPPGLLSAGGG